MLEAALAPNMLKNANHKPAGDSGLRDCALGPEIPSNRTPLRDLIFQHSLRQRCVNETVADSDQPPLLATHRQEIF